MNTDNSKRLKRELDLLGKAISNYNNSKSENIPYVNKNVKFKISYETEKELCEYAKLGKDVNGPYNLAVMYNLWNRR